MGETRQERIVMRVLVRPGVHVTISTNGEFDAREVDRLIRLLETSRDVLADDEPDHPHPASQSDEGKL